MTFTIDRVILEPKSFGFQFKFPEQSYDIDKPRELAIKAFIACLTERLPSKLVRDGSIVKLEGVPKLAIMYTLQGETLKIAEILYRITQ